MRVLLSTTGSRGDVQPLVALAVQLMDLGQEVHLCAPPDFGDWITTFGIPFTPVGPELRHTAQSRPARPTPEQIRRQVEDMVTDQFAKVAGATADCDVIVAWGPLQIAVRSVAEHLGIPYVFLAFCPTSLPSPHHPPPVLPNRKRPEDADNETLWALDAQSFNDTFLDILNARRASAGLTPVADVRSHLFTDRPWLAADAALAPWPDPADQHVVQTGALLLRDERPLSAELEAFLAAGEPPVYFGFGSMPAPPEVGLAVIHAVRSLGRRAIVSRGWADVALVDDEPDCLSIGEANLRTLFKRVAAVVHHGGSGTTTVATLAGAPQVIVPQWYDQLYFAQRVQDLGIGVAHAPGAPTAESLVAALDEAFAPDVVVRAKAVAEEVRADGALITAQRLVRGS
jgi:vancomycin aglycone glucosyltransferase